MTKKQLASPQPATPTNSIYKEPCAPSAPPFNAFEAWTFRVETFLNQRNYRNDVDSAQLASLLAISRFALLLNAAREEMDNCFSLVDIEQLLRSFGTDIYMPDEDVSLHTSFAAEHGWEFLEDIPPPMRTLYHKLRRLNAVQNFALADVLERVSNVYLPSGNHNSIASAVSAAGLLLNDSPFVN